jgi:hypothetical protein
VWITVADRGKSLIINGKKPYSSYPHLTHTRPNPDFGDRLETVEKTRVEKLLKNKASGDLLPRSFIPFFDFVLHPKLAQQDNAL